MSTTSRIEWTQTTWNPVTGCDRISPGCQHTIMVARALGRFGIGVNLAASYCRAARWRVFDSGQAAKAVARHWAERQPTVLDHQGGGR
jgi:protein gp37